MWRHGPMNYATYEAYELGQTAAQYACAKSALPKRLYTNPYPEHAKIRRAAWNDGYNKADLMGDYHGRNI